MSRKRANKSKQAPNSQRAPRPGPAAGLACAVLLVVMTVAAYLPATRCGYIWDDDAYVYNNPTLRSGAGLGRIWFDLRATPQYYPMVHTSYWLEYRFWGLDPAGYHVVNILLHAVSAVLLWRVLKLLEIPGAWVAAAIFALHPVHVESVAWITERKNVLSGVFYLAAALAYLRCALKPAPGPRRWYVAALVLFACALLSKTVACTLPAALLLVLWWKRKGIRRRDLTGLAPFFVLGVALGLLTVLLETQHVGAVGKAWDLSFIDRCLIAGRALWFYAGKLVWPQPLMFIYPRWRIDAGAWQQYLYPIAAVAAPATLWLARRRVGTGPLVAAGCFAVTLFPALGFFNVYPMLFSYVADHFQYLAGIGLMALAVAGAHAAAARAGRWGRRAGAAVAVCLLGVLAAQTWGQQRGYANAEALWRETLKKNPNASIAHNNLGNILKRQADALRSRGDPRSARNKTEQAVLHYYKALEGNPERADTHANLTFSLRSLGRTDEAIHHGLQAIKFEPKHFGAHTNLANALASKGRYDQAIVHYHRALEVNPDYAPAHYNLAVTLRLQGKAEEAVRHYRRAIDLSPRHAGALRGLAQILATHPDAKIRDGAEAVRLAERAAKLTGHRDPKVLDTLAAAYAATGQFARAVRTAEAAASMARRIGARALADAIRRRLERYRRAVPPRRPG